MTSTFLFCAGDNKRWTNDSREKPSIKHLAPVADEPLLARTTRQLLTRQHSPIIVARDWLMLGLPHLYPPENKTLCHSIWSTQGSWQGRVFLLLGDVVFSDAALDTVLDSRFPVQFFGSWERGDLYAMAFEASLSSRILHHLSLVLQANRNGMLWELYRSCCGFALDDHKLSSFLYTDIHDEWTIDIDYVDHWLDWNKRWEARVKGS